MDASCTPELEWLRELALSLAAAHGDDHPRDGKYVRTQRRAAVSVAMFGGWVDSDQEVYCVALRGQFVGNSAPHEAAIPKGSNLTFTVDVVNGHICDWGISDRVPDLTPLGRPQPLGLGPEMN